MFTPILFLFLLLELDLCKFNSYVEVASEEALRVLVDLCDGGDQVTDDDGERYGGTMLIGCTVGEEGHFERVGLQLDVILLFRKQECVLK